MRTKFYWSWAGGLVLIVMTVVFLLKNICTLKITLPFSVKSLRKITVEAFKGASEYKNLSNYPGLNNTFKKGYKINSSYQKTFF